MHGQKIIRYKQQFNIKNLLENAIERHYRDLETNAYVWLGWACKDNNEIRHYIKAFEITKE